MRSTILKLVLGSIILAVALFFFLSVRFIQKTTHRIIPQESVKKSVDAVVVFGAGVRGRELSDALRLRMDTALKLFEKNIARRLILSGDGTSPYYNETEAMFLYSIKKGVSSSQIVVDPQGYSSVESVLRLKKHFSVFSAYFVSQEAHLPRLLFLAEHAGIDAQGVSAPNFNEDFSFLVREFFARVKDFGIVYTNFTPDGLR
jgi:SanA protein